MQLYCFGVAAVVLTAFVISETEIVEIIKEVIYHLVKNGYEAAKIIQIIRLYAY